MGLLTLFIVSGLHQPTAYSAPKKKCTAKQEMTLLGLDRRVLSLNRIINEMSVKLAVNEVALSAAVATNNVNESTRIGIEMTSLRKKIQSEQKTLKQIGQQKDQILKACKPRASSGSGGLGSATQDCSPSELSLIRELAQQHFNTLSQIEGHELEIYRQRKLALNFQSLGRSSDVAKAQIEIQRRSKLGAELAAYASVIKRQFEIANGSCANSGVTLSQLLSKVFVPNSLISMNIEKISSANMSVNRPRLDSSTGNLNIACDPSASDSSPYAKVDVYFSLTTKKPEIWDIYNGAGIDSDAFTVAAFRPNYIKQPDSSFTFRDNNGNPLTFNAFKADLRTNGLRDICEFEIVPIVPSDYATDAIGIWYFVIASNDAKTIYIWSLSGFTISNYLNPVR